MYAVVKAGGRQHKVEVGDVVEINRLDGAEGATVSLPALLVVDGRTVTSEAAALSSVTVTAEIVGHHKGPKIKILKYKNKTGYRRRIGHRQHLTEVLVTDIDDGTPKKAEKKAAAEKPAKADKPDKADRPAKAEKKAEKADKPAKAAKPAAQTSKTDEQED